MSARAVHLRVKFLVLALLLLVGCGAPDGPLLLAYQGSDAGREAAELAAAEWRDTCGADVRLDPAGIPLVETDGEIPSTLSGYTSFRGTRLMWIHVRPAPVDQTPLYAHEIGHALGLQHTAPGVDDLMTGQTFGPDAHVTEADCQALDRIR